MVRYLIVGALAILISTSPAAIAQTDPCAQSLQNKADVAPVGSVVDVPACTYRETVYVGHSVTLDGHNVAVMDGDNLRDRWFWIAANDVTIKNFTMRNTNTSLQEGALATAAGTARIVIDHNDLGATKNGSQVGIGGTTDSRVTNNSIHDGGQLGIETYQNTRLLIQGNHVFNNSTAGVDPEFGAGGIKAIQDTDSQIIGNEVDHNIGPGIWVDILANGYVIASNNVHDQAYNPIFYEVSSNADIYGNTVSASPSGPLNWGCIVVSSSANVNVHDNTCIDTSYLRAQLDNRPDVPPNAGHDIHLQNNRVVRPNPPLATSWWQYDPNGPLIPGQNGNVDLGNVLSQTLNTPVPTSTSTPRPTRTPTLTPTPKISCQMNVRLNGIEQGWKNC